MTTQSPRGQSRLTTQEHDPEQPTARVSWRPVLVYVALAMGLNWPGNPALPMSRSYSTLAVLVGMAGAAAAGSAVAFTDVHQVWHAVMGAIPTSESVRHVVEGFGVGAPIAFVLTQAGQVLAVPVPAGPFTLAGVAAFGSWMAFVLSLAGTVAGSVAAFLLGRRFGWPLIERLAGKKALDKHGRKLGGSDGMWLLPVLCMPVPAGGDVACFVAGLCSIRLRRFVLLLTVARVPGTTLSVLLASGITGGSAILLVAGLIGLGVSILAACYRHHLRSWLSRGVSSRVQCWIRRDHDDNGSPAMACQLSPAQGATSAESRRTSPATAEPRQPYRDTTVWPPRPVAFAFSGGGSHGAVHIGQLRALQEYGVRPDFLVGSSVGALNAAVLAANPEAGAADRLEALWRHVRARDIFCRPDAAVRQRRAVFGNDGLRRRVARHFPPNGTIEDLPIPLYVLATDSATRQQRVLDRGALTPALLASCAIPVVFPPVTIGGARLIDGGIRHDLPIAESFKLGAASVVAFPATRWPRPIGYRSSAPIDDHRVLLLDGAASPGTGWTFCRTRELIDHGYRETSTKLRTLGFTLHHGYPRRDRAGGQPQRDFPSCRCNVTACSVTVARSRSISARASASSACSRVCPARPGTRPPTRPGPLLGRAADVHARGAVHAPLLRTSPIPLPESH